ncbi:transglycosylase domain-containing protein [Sporosarcina ureilytica]|uniref:Penicillin-binding protein n=1 Tax=Sporosarcina ureilytica TaxID=298596 RepID=A0A1D8JE64_9BACL|nr:transglycosylase domain-containing protein [Sporosarcina ureilytica]AOV07004.1 penicillin-binding protein [Sporosarcina ureilytica]
MKRIIGVLFIVIATPLLFITQRAIVAEIDEVETMKSQLAETVQFTAPTYELPITMKDRSGDVFSEIYVEWRTPLPLSDIPHFAKQLFLESEDNQFYTHRGYDISAIIRAFIANAQTDRLQQGGSTITQQLIRMQYLTTDKTYERKVLELIYAAELEKQLTKDEILEAYLNEMYFGNRVYGIGAAATYYFNRPIQELNHAEIAFISAIPNNPSLYDPLVNFELTKARQERLLETMQKNDFMTVEEAEQLKNAPIQLSLKTKANDFPMYSDYVMTELDELIAQNEGFTSKIALAENDDEKEAFQTELEERISQVLREGIVIETALHAEKQSADEKALSALLQSGNLQAGAVVVDNDTREIVSIFGGRDYVSTHFHRAFQAVRQPGSAIKPLLVYGPLFETHPYTEKTAVNSGPICIQAYCPKNVGGYTYGTTTIQEAFRHSHNTTAVRMLQLTGIETAFAYLEPFAFQSVSSVDMNFPSALGGFQKGVTPLELANAYTSFIDGAYSRPHAIRTVKNREGTVLYEWDDEKTEVWSPSTVATMRALMKDVVLNGTGKGVPYTTSYTGIKTGTTDYYKDLWTAGLNEQYTTAVWLGYDRPSSIQFASQQKRHLQAIGELLKVYE